METNTADLSGDFINTVARILSVPIVDDGGCVGATCTFEHFVSQPLKIHYSLIRLTAYLIAKDRTYFPLTMSDMHNREMLEPLLPPLIEILTADAN